MVLTPFIDIQTLSRMTGKDFSGPTPEIRPPAQLSLTNQPKHTDQEQRSSILRDESRVAAVENGDEEVLGEILTFNG